MLDSSVKGPPTVYLNHLYLVPDPSTFSGIGHSEFLRKEFAGFSAGTVRAEGNDTWSGMYLMGKRTYLEFLKANPSGKQKEGDYGIGFGVEEEGGLARVAALLRVGTRGQVKRHLRKRKVGDREVPWFRTVDVRYDRKQNYYSRMADSSNLWVMEYLRSYMEEFKPPNPNPGGGSNARAISRERYNAPSFSGERLFEDVTGVELALNRRKSTHFVGELRALGYEIRTSGEQRVCTGPDVTLTIAPETHESSGIKVIRMSLLRWMGHRQVYRFGARSTLTLAGRAAIWRF